MTNIPSLPFVAPEKLLGRGNSYSPSALFVDANLGVGVSGIDFLAKFRHLWPFIPIFVITGELNRNLIGRALASGANDFIRKPLMPEEILARLDIRVTEMKERQGNELIEIADIVFNARLGTLQRNERLVHLPPLESELLLFLARHMGFVTSKQSLRTHLWGETTTCANALDKKISNLRKALKDCSDCVELVSAYGGKISLQIRAAETSPKR
jgi:DNA-binding response OmpR family regulator